MNMHAKLVAMHARLTQFSTINAFRIQTTIDGQPNIQTVYRHDLLTRLTLGIVGD